LYVRAAWHAVTNPGPRRVCPQPFRSRTMLWRGEHQSLRLRTGPKKHRRRIPFWKHQQSPKLLGRQADRSRRRAQIWWARRSISSPTSSRLSDSIAPHKPPDQRSDFAGGRRRSAQAPL